MCVFLDEFNKFNNKGAQILDSMTLKYFLHYPHATLLFLHGNSLREAV